jgi:hypothetical protein
MNGDDWISISEESVYFKDGSSVKERDENNSLYLRAYPYSEK